MKSLILLFFLSTLYSMDFSEMSETQLLEIVRTVPASEYKDNFEIYKILFTRDRENMKYRKKFIHYREKLKKQKKPKLSNATNNKSDLQTCREYKTKFDKYYSTFNNASPQKKKYSIIMVKSYFDSIIIECDSMENYGKYSKMIPEVKSAWKYNTSSSTRNAPQNQWKY